MTPKISVLMSVYNDATHLGMAIESVLSQTFTDFEFIIIDDCSTDESLSIIKHYNDPRIRLEQNVQNIGLTASLNIGLNLTKGEYLARMDSDDVCLSARLEKQVAFLESHPQVGICGTWVEIIGGRDNEVWDFPEDDASIRCRLVFEPVIVHSTVMLRRQILNKLNLQYDPDYKWAQDYDLWARLAEHTTFANIGEVLLRYRLHARQVGSLHEDDQMQAAGHVRLAQLSKFGIEPTDEEFAVHQRLSIWDFDASKDFLLEAEKWLNKVQQANQQTQKLPEPAFARMLAERWFAACKSAQPLGWWTWKTFWGSSLSSTVNFHPIQVAKFAYFCLRASFVHG